MRPGRADRVAAPAASRASASTASWRQGFRRGMVLAYRPGPRGGRGELTRLAAHGSDAHGGRRFDPTRRDWEDRGITEMCRNHRRDAFDNAVVLLALHDEKDALEAEPLRVKQIVFWLFLTLAMLLVTFQLRSPLVAIWSLLAALTSISLVIHTSGLLTRINHLRTLIDERERCG